MFK
ncbi:hypothetical protein YPPY06_3379, partial [Yersinia pestis PY-06]|jgi:integrase/recombinase XerD